MDTKKLLQIKKSGVKGDPFGRQYEEIMKMLVTITDAICNNPDLTFKRDNFQLVGILLECCTKIYSQRVESTKRDVTSFAAKIIANNDKAHKKEKAIECPEASSLERERPVQKDPVSPPVVTTVPSPTTTGKVAGELDESHDSGIDSMESTGYDSEGEVATATEDATECVPEVSIPGVGPNENMVLDRHTVALEAVEKVTECITLSDDEEELLELNQPSINPSPSLAPSNVDNDIEVLPEAPASIEEPVPVLEPSNVDNDIEFTPELAEPVATTEDPLPILASPSENITEATDFTTVDNIVTGTEEEIDRTLPDIPRKRMRIDYGSPPILTSCFDEEASHEFKKPPVLVPEVDTPRRKIRTREAKPKPLVSPDEVNNLEGDLHIPDEVNNLEGDLHTPDEVNNLEGDLHTLDEVNNLEGDLHTPDEVNNLEGDLHTPDEFDSLESDLHTPDDVNRLESDLNNTAEPESNGSIPPLPLLAKSESTLDGETPPAESTPTSIAQPTPELGLPEGVVIKVEKDDPPFPENTISSLQEFFSCENTEFTPEDEVQILNSIKELHQLSFTCDLSNQEFETSVENTLKRLESIYKEHNVSIHRRMSQDIGQPCPVPQNSTIGKWNIKDDSTLPDSSEVHELFSHRISERLQDTEYTGKTIMEMTNEKSREDSDSKMREMIREMQKNIVPKFTQIPLIEENTQGFFQRVRTFENRMMKVLEAEKSKEEFDIRKYEMEVLDVTNTEIELQVLSDEESQTPMSSPPLSGMTPEANTAPVSEHNPYLPLNFNGMTSPSSSSDSGSSNGMRWISLKKIFSHMKTLQHQEAARMFYAVLALLSFENLEINYDNHCSQESVATVAAASTSGLDLDGKYARGLKIMSSRCLDVDTEDVYVAVLSSKLRTESFKESLEHNNVEQELAEPTQTSSNSTPQLSTTRSPNLRITSAHEQLRNELHVQIGPNLNNTKSMNSSNLMNNLLKTVQVRKRNASVNSSPKGFHHKKVKRNP